MHKAWIPRWALVSAALGLWCVLVAACGASGNFAQDGGPNPYDATSVDASACASGTLCSGACVDVQNDNAHCGACGTACTGGQVCSQGKCGATCGGDTKLCGSTCVDVKYDPNNCGDCSKACSAGDFCSNGACVSTCSSSQTLCGVDAGSPYCASTKTDNANCGACGVQCPSGEVCSNGACASACGANETLCTPDAGAPYCASTADDNANCGACGVACGTGYVCQNSACTNACASQDGGTETLCTPDGGSPYCANTSADNANCGGCGIACGTGQLCKSGACTNGCASQDGGTETLCTPDGGSPYCANTATDNANCGACGNVCTNKLTCINGTCATGYTLIGSYNVNSGPAWSTNPATYTCQQACALVFGGNASSYSCSVSNTAVTHTAWESCYADATNYCYGSTPVSEGYKVNTKYDCGTLDCACSAYVEDNCYQGTSINYCWQ